MNIILFPMIILGDKSLVRHKNLSYQIICDGTIIFSNKIFGRQKPSSFCLKKVKNEHQNYLVVK